MSGKVRTTWISDDIGTCPEKKVWNSVSGKYRTGLHLINCCQQQAAGLDGHACLKAMCFYWLWDGPLFISVVTDKTVSWDWGSCFIIWIILTVATATVEIHTYFAFYWDILMLSEANWSWEICKNCWFFGHWKTSGGHFDSRLGHVNSSEPIRRGVDCFMVSKLQHGSSSFNHSPPLDCLLNKRSGAETSQRDCNAWPCNYLDHFHHKMAGLGKPSLPQKYIWLQVINETWILTEKWHGLTMWYNPGGGTPYVMGDTYVPRFWPPFFTLAGSSTIFLGYFSHPPTAKLSFGVEKLPIFTKIDLFGPKFNFFLDLFGSNFQRPAAHPHQFSGRVPPPPPPPPPGDITHS